MLKKTSIAFFPARHSSACAELLSKGERAGVRAQASSCAKIHETRAYAILLSILTIGAVAVWLVVASATAAAAAESDPGTVNFEMHCATCHAPNGSGDTAVGKSMKIPDLRSPAVQSLPDAQLVDAIANGKGPMPGFKSSLSKDEIDALVKHVHQLAKTK
jgi:mono/diheme cytochrome c family protein